ncbi:type II secretion system F family protein [Vibrio hannami]|uniref:type II secretion system F family protein n=1 Tax=Vibrio hannami TaxID=2717094 RepID=UPI00241069EA|nr:type II secretion system F family protein [Vibrio hannami]MDG3085988.1 type II secretion system F family protein [Vibrio hannami]
MNSYQVLFAIYALLAVGILLLMWTLVSGFKRKKKLEKIGLSKEDVKSEDDDLLHNIGGTLSGLLAASEDDIEAKFTAAGFYNVRWAYLFLPIKYTLLAMGVLVASLLYFYSSVVPSNILLGCLFWIIGVIIVPDAYLSIRARRIRERVSGQLPYLLDLMAVCVQTGMTIESTMAYLAVEMIAFDKDLAYLLKKTNDRARIVGLEKALEELYERMPSAEIRSFVMTINQSLQYGSSIYKVLTTLAADIRETHMLTLEEKVGKLSAKMSAPLVLFIMFPIVILIIAPGIARLM